MNHIVRSEENEGSKPERGATEARVMGLLPPGDGRERGRERQLRVSLSRLPVTLVVGYSLEADAAPPDPSSECQ